MGKRFTIFRNGIIMGTYPGDSEDAALDALAQDEKHENFAALVKKTGLKRDHHKLDEVKE